MVPKESLVDKKVVLMFYFYLLLGLSAGEHRNSETGLPNDHVAFPPHHGNVSHH